MFKKDRCSDIHIMPGSSHWFQVHDQKPFRHPQKSIGCHKKKKSIHDFPRFNQKRWLTLRWQRYTKRNQVHSSHQPFLTRSDKCDCDLAIQTRSEIYVSQIHCPPLSQLNSTKRLRELEFIMKNIYEEQEAERKKMLADGERLRKGLSLNGKSYLLRKRNTMMYQASNFL